MNSQRPRSPRISPFAGMEDSVSNGLRPPSIGNGNIQYRRCGGGIGNGGQGGGGRGGNSGSGNSRGGGQRHPHQDVPGSNIKPPTERPPPNTKPPTTKPKPPQGAEGRVPGFDE